MNHNADHKEKANLNTFQGMIERENRVLELIRSELYPIDDNKNALLANIHKLHTTELGVERIRRNLQLQNENLVRESFWNVYRPGCLEHYVLNQLTTDEAFVPEFKRQGYGKILLDYSLEKAAELGAGALCFEGNIDFYGKSGFTFASEFGIRYHGLPEGEDASFFLCKGLIPGYLDGVTGEYATPQGYFVDEAEAENFDKQFPYKEKLKLPGQLF